MKLWGKAKKKWKSWEHKLIERDSWRNAKLCDPGVEFDDWKSGKWQKEQRKEFFRLMKMGKKKKKR